MESIGHESPNPPIARNARRVCCCSLAARNRAGTGGAEGHRREAASPRCGAFAARARSGRRSCMGRDRHGRRPGAMAPRYSGNARFGRGTVEMGSRNRPTTVQQRGISSRKCDSTKVSCTFDNLHSFDRFRPMAWPTPISTLSYRRLVCQGTRYEKAEWLNNVSSLAVCGSRSFQHSRAMVLCLHLGRRCAGL